MCLPPSEFNCIVEGYFGPGRPTVEWRRRGGGLGHSGRVVAGRLTFVRVAKSDEGEYACTVTSADGRRTQEATTVLYVRDRGMVQHFALPPVCPLGAISVSVVSLLVSETRNATASLFYRVFESFEDNAAQE